MSYEPGKKQPARSKETAGAAEIPLPAVGSLVRVIGNFGRQCRAIWNRWMAVEWQSFPGDILMQRKRWSAPENCAPRPGFQPSAEVGVKACNPPRIAQPNPGFGASRAKVSMRSGLSPLEHAAPQPRARRVVVEER